MRAEELAAALCGKQRGAQVDGADARMAHGRVEAELADTKLAVTMAGWVDPAYAEVVAVLVEPQTVLVAAAARMVNAAAEWAAAAAVAAAMGAKHVEIQNAGGAGDVYNADDATPQAAPTPGEPPTSEAKPAPDPLRIGGRIVLGPGETFAGSAATKDRDGTMMCAAAVDTPTGRVVHVAAPVDPEAKKHWKGANAPPQETRIDEDYNPDEDDLDDCTHTVDTYADVTVIVDAADVAGLPDQVAKVIARAKAHDREFKKAADEYDRLYDAQMQLEGKRFGGDAQRYVGLRCHEERNAKVQAWRKAKVQRARAALDEVDRARFDAIQEQLDAAGVDVFDADKEEEAAEVCGWTVEQYRDAKELAGVPVYARTPEQRQREEALNRYGRDADIPPLLDKQAAIVYGLNDDEYQEMKRLERIGARRERGYARNTGRTPDQEARYQELRNSKRGAVGANKKETDQLRNQGVFFQETHHNTKVDWAGDRERLARMDAEAKPLSPADAARLAEVRAEMDTLGEHVDELADRTETIAVPGRNGTTLLFEAAQREEEGGVDYRVSVRPANADEDWSPNADGDAYTTDAAGFRKAAATVARLAGDA